MSAHAAQRNPVALTAEKLRRQTAQEAEAAFEAAFRENWPRLVATLYRLVGEGAEAEDLALETFWRLHRNPLMLSDGAGLRGWLYRVATNLGLNALRARGRRQRYEEQAGSLDLQESRADDPAAEVERRQERLRVRQGLAHIKPRSANCCCCATPASATQRSLAALGVAPASVGALLARAEKEFEERYRKLE